MIPAPSRPLFAVTKSDTSTNKSVITWRRGTLERLSALVLTAAESFFTFAVRSPRVSPCRSHHQLDRSLVPGVAGFSRSLRQHRAFVSIARHCPR